MNTTITPWPIFALQDVAASWETAFGLYPETPDVTDTIPLAEEENPYPLFPTPPRQNAAAPALCAMGSVRLFSPPKNSQSVPKGDHYSAAERETGNGIALDPSLKRLDVFLGVGTADRIALTNRRILGLVNGVDIKGEFDRFLREELKDLDFHLLKRDGQKLREVLARFFQNPDVVIQRVFPYYDRTAEMEKPNVLGIVVFVSGIQRTVYLKFSEEGPRREALGLRINNLLTDSPIPFMANGYTFLQMGVRGIAWDLHAGFHDEAKRRSFHFHLGKAEEFARLLQLGDRKAEDLLVLETHVSHVDFGASFSRHESVRRFVDKSYEDDFQKGRTEAQKIILRNYKRHRRFLAALLDNLPDHVVEEMNRENMRGLFPMREHPKTIIEGYLHDIGFVA